MEPDAAVIIPPPVPAAIHPASALPIGDDPEACVTHDERLAAPALEAGLNVLMPGR